MTIETATWMPLYWEPVADSGERIMAGAVVDYQGEITAHRLIRDDVLDCLFGKSADNTRTLLDAALNMQLILARATGVGAQTAALLGLTPGRAQTSAARSRVEALRHAVMLYASLASLDKLDDLDEADPPSQESVNKRFSTEVREQVAITHPSLSAGFNRAAVLLDEGDPVRFGYLSNNTVLHFGVLHPVRQSGSVRDARARLWELARARDYGRITRAALIMAVPRSDDATLGNRQRDAAIRNQREIEREADSVGMRLLPVHNAIEGSIRLIEMAL